MTKLQAVKGTQDFLGEKCALFNYVVEKAKTVANSFSYQESLFPILEHTEVFKRSLGDSSDIVSKEMYTFEDRKGRSLTLRPEFTASIVRSIISSGIQKNLPLKLFSYGPLFRYERPQRGRYRQFHQVNFEYIGNDNPSSDAELISLANHFLNSLGLKNLKLELNSLGDSTTRKNYTEKLVDYFSKYKNDLSEDSKIRLQNNPLRILDSKDQGDKDIIKSAPLISSVLNKESKVFFDTLLGYLDGINIGYNLNESLVRGLDYYTHTVFEFTTDQLGAQNAVLAGGRYNNLIKKMGGDDIPAVGFASGIERLMELFEGQLPKDRSVNILLFKEEFLLQGLKLSEKIRDRNIRTNFEVVKNLNKSLKKSFEDNAKFIVFIGEEEAKNNMYKIKDLDSRAEESLNLDQLINKINSYEF